MFQWSGVSFHNYFPGFVQICSGVCNRLLNTHFVTLLSNTQVSKVNLILLPHCHCLHFHFFEFGLLHLGSSSKRLGTHNSTTPVFSDLIKSVIVVVLDRLNNVVQRMFVLWADTGETESCCCLLVDNLSKSESKMLQENIF